MTTFGGDAAFATVAGGIKDLPARGEQEVSDVAEGARRPIPACLRCVSCSARRRPDDFGTWLLRRTDRDAIASRLMRYRDQNAQDWW